MISRLNKYIFVQSFIGFAISLAAVSASIILVDLVEQMRAISGIAGTNVLTALGFTMLRLPSLIEQTIPIAILVGTIITFTALSRKSEIVALRAAGFSAWQFLAPLGAMVVIIGLIMVTIFRPISTSMSETYEAKRAALTNVLDTIGPNEVNISWITFPSTQGQIVLSGTKTGANRFENAMVLVFDSEGSDFLKRIDGQSVEKLPTSLKFNNAVIAEAGKESIAIPNYQLSLTDDSKISENQDAKSLSLWELPFAAQAAKISGGSPERYWLKFWELLFTPVSMLAIAVFAASMMLAQDRSGGKAKATIIAMIVGLAIYFLGDVTGILATSGWLPSSIAAISPPIFALAMVLAYLSYKEDGYR